MTSLKNDSSNILMAAQHSVISVLIMPDGRAANPYQTLLAESLEQVGVKVSFAQGYRRGLPLFREVLTQRPSLLHLHWILPYLKGSSRLTRILYAMKFLLDVLLVKLTGVRVVWTVHNRITHDAPFPELEQWVRRSLARLVDRIILHNRSTLEDLAQDYRFPPDKATIILHGHYRDIYPPRISAAEARQALGLPATGTVFLNLGLLRPYKGIESLLDIWCTNQESFADCTLVIAGKAEPAYAEMLKQKTARYENVILMPEFIPDEQIHLFFSAASVAVLPYKKILNSGSLILAMSYGLPVIAPELGSISEYLGSANHLLFDPQNDLGLFKAIQLAANLDLDHVSLDQLHQATVTECDRLDWSEIGKRTCQVYLKATHT